MLRRPRQVSGAKLTKLERFTTPQNLLGVLFLAVLGFNLLVMALDFPRFELVGVILLTLFVLFFVLWLGAFFNLNLMRPINRMFESIYAFANAGFYFVYFLMLMILLLIVYITRWLDYWEVMPNEILHHHGPLERPRAIPDHEPEVRQGDSRRSRVRACWVRGGWCCTFPTWRSRSCSTTCCSSIPRKRRSKS